MSSRYGPCCQAWSHLAARSWSANGDLLADHARLVTGCASFLVVVAGWGEAVRAVPRTRVAVGLIAGDGDGRVKPAEPAGPAGQRERAGPRPDSQVDVAVGIIVARAVDVEVAAQHEGGAAAYYVWVGGYDLHAGADRVQVRPGDRAEPTGLAGELMALLRDVEFSAPGRVCVLRSACGGERCDQDDGQEQPVDRLRRVTPSLRWWQLGHDFLLW